MTLSPCDVLGVLGMAIGKNGRLTDAKGAAGDSYAKLRKDVCHAA